MKIFFSASVRAGREFQPQYLDIVSILKKYGEVLGEHLTEDTLPRHGETELAEKEIFEREMIGLAASDVCIAEVTTPSLGVGYIIATACTMNKRIICLYYGDDSYKLSAMIRGNDQITVYRYENKQKLEEIFQNAFD